MTTNVVRCAFCDLGQPERCTGFVDVPCTDPAHDRAHGRHAYECAGPTDPRADRDPLADDGPLTDADAYIAPHVGQPNRCASCGSDDIYLESPAEGWSCRSCGRSDSDE